MRFLDDYDYFEENETWYFQKSAEIYVDGQGEKEELIKFEEEAEVVIQSISKESGYGYAMVRIDGHQTKLGLDELYDLVMMT